MASNRLLRPWIYFLLVLSIPIAANLMTMIFHLLIIRPVFPSATMVIYEDKVPIPAWVEFLLIRVLPFCIPAIIAAWYILPVLSGLKVYEKAGALSEKADVRLLNAPVMVSLIGISGWIVAYLVIIVQTKLFSDLISLNSLFPIFLPYLLSGAASFVLTYYSLQWLTQYYYIPRLFIHKKLSLISKTIKLSIVTKFFIYCFAVCFYPLIIFASALFYPVHLVKPDEVDKILVMLGIIYIIFAAILTYLFSKTYQDPLLEMKAATETIQSGDYSVNIQIKTNDEIGKLGEGINEMSSDLYALTKNLENLVDVRTSQLNQKTEELEYEKNQLKKRNEIMESELELARKIQYQMIPQVSPIPQIAFYYQTMDKVGGDFYDFIRFRESSKTGIFISDVSGHGVPAAFITSMIKTIIMQHPLEANDPAKLLSYLNQALINQTAGNFITAFYAIFDFSTRELSYSNSGHNPPYIIHQGKVTQLKLEKSGIPLGILTNEELELRQKSYRNEQTIIDPVTKVVFYTDGLTEAIPIDQSHENSYCQDFETALMEKVMLEHQDLKGRQFIDKMIEKLIEFRGNRDFADDVCLICLDV